MRHGSIVAFICVLSLGLSACQQTPVVPTPVTMGVPHINGPRIYGERPGRPFLYTVPATGDLPLTFTAQGLPDGLAIDPVTGRITGSVANAGDYKVHVTATNGAGSNTRSLLI